MLDRFKILSGSFNLNVGKWQMPVPYWEAILIVALVFVLVLSLAEFRRHKMNWSFSGALFGIFFGFLLALFLEGFLIIGGKTALTSVLGWKNPPPYISNALDAGRSKLVQVLGISTANIPSSFAKESYTVQTTIQVLQNLTPSDTKTVKAIFCK